MTARGVLPLLTVLALAAGCSDDSVPVQGIVLITLDTTRADRLGCYGYQHGATPNLDALARDATVFREAVAPVPVTLPSHSTMFTGLYPPRHGVRYNGMFRLADSSVTVAELLRDAGWKTAGVPASFPLSERTGIGQGFESYHDMFRDLFRGGGQGEGDVTVDSERPADEVSRIGVEFLEGAVGRPFFLWLHYWEPHYPYHPPFPFSSKFRDRPYDGEIAYMDHEIGKVFDALQRLGLRDRVLVIVAGDHGEGLYDHGEKMHANLVYETTMRVPLIIRPPGGGSRVIDEPVTLADLTPTMLDFAGVDGPEMEGISLKSSVLGGQPPRRDIYFESLAGSLTYAWSPLEGIRRGKWKYVRSSGPELFDLDEDPGESRNVESVYEEVSTEMESTLSTMEAVWQALGGNSEPTGTPLDARELEVLASLGYLGGFISEEQRDGAHPKDVIHLESEIFTARRELGSKQFEAAQRRLDALLEADPTNRLALIMAARAAAARREYDEALAYTAKALAIYPDLAPAYILEGEIWVAKGEIETAVKAFRAGLVAKPDDMGLKYRLAVALYAQDRIDESEAIVDETLPGAGENSPTFLVLRAACRAKAGDPDGARSALTEAVAAGYRAREVLEEEPLLEPLRAIPGFGEILETLPEARQGPTEARSG
jgi:arylsulfatase A-like enzyme/Tfp pilus assembly protein PilF